MLTLGGGSDSSRSCIPATEMGDLYYILGSRLQADIPLAVEGSGAVNHWVGFLSAFSFFQTSKMRK